MTAHVRSNNLNAHEYVRALEFFVWQHREAPKEWPWLMKNQRWASPLCIKNTTLYQRCSEFKEKTRTVPHVLFYVFCCFFFLELSARIQLPAIPTLIDRKVRERASWGAQIAFCLITANQLVSFPVHGQCVYESESGREMYIPCMSTFVQQTSALCSSMSVGIGL